MTGKNNKQVKDGDSNRPEEQKILEARARKTAKKVQTETAVFDQNEYVVFRVENSLYAVSSHFVSEVLKNPVITPLPQSPSQLLGLTNLRGQVITVISLEGLMPNSKSKGQPKVNFAIILKNKSLVLGLGVEEILETRKIAQELILDEYPGLEKSKDKHIIGVTSDQVLIMNIEYILNKKEIIIHTT